MSLHDVTAMHGDEIREAWNIPQLALPITEFLADAELSLPISPCMSKEQMEWVVECVNKFYGRTD